MGIEIDRADFAHLESQVFLAPEDGPQGISDLGGDQACDRDLIEQRLEQMVVMPVDQCDLYGRAGQFLGGFQATEPGPNNHDTGKFFRFHSRLQRLCNLSQLL
jgi:hypothetical protein